jgi:hypothetical protein
MLERFRASLRLNRRNPETPTVYDPYREVRITRTFQPYEGPSTLLGYENPQPSREYKAIIPITTPELFITGMHWLIFTIEHESTKPHTMKPSGFGWKNSAGELKKRQTKYKRDLRAMEEKYSGLHTDIVAKMNRKERAAIQTMMTEARKYRVEFSPDTPAKDPEVGDEGDNMMEDGLPDGGINHY